MFDLTTTMLYVFNAAAWREAFKRTESADKSFKKWLYDTYLRSTAWKLKRHERIEMDRSTCQSSLCFRVSGLQVHHKTYQRIGDEDAKNDLITLCDNCHRGEHGFEQEQWLDPAQFAAKLESRSDARGKAKVPVGARNGADHNGPHRAF